MSPSHRLRRLLALLLAATAVFGAAPAAASVAPACPPQRARPLTLKTLCLINRARIRRGAPRIRLERRLERVARGHSRDMVANHYFAHESRSGVSSSGRIARAGWMRGRRHWIVGENLGWHAGGPSPSWVVRAWLHSPPHRHILLNRRYRVVGIGIARGTPFSSARGGATYTADFGS
jgi:uncharacterized protein YkwD